MSSRRIFGSVLKRIALVGVALLVAVLLAEVLLRAGGLAPTEGLATVNAADFERLPGIFAPGQRLIVRQIRALPYRVTIDSLGYRGAPFQRAKPLAETRTLLVGDSFVHGDFVHDEWTFPAQLERVLAARCRGVRVINAGLGGSTIVDHRELIARAHEIGPDLVVLGFSENDVSDLAKETSMWGQLRSNREVKSRFPMSLVYGALHNTALWNLALAVRGRIIARRTAEAAPVGSVTSGADSGVARLRERYRATLVEIRDSLQARGTPLVFVAFPAHLTLEGTWPPDQMRWALGVATDAGLPAFDLSVPLKRVGLPVDSLYLLPHDGHPSPRGHAVAAAYLADGLMEQPALSGVCREP